MEKIVFVAMPFNEIFNDICESVIKPAILESSMLPLRVDELTGNRNIIEDIEEGIDKSFIVFSDITDKNSNVFYEVGYARALGKQLIVATQNPSDMPFDLRHRRCIAYTTTKVGLQKFKNDLKVWIKEIVLNQDSHAGKPIIYVHGTKFDVPNKNEFWTDLLRNASNKFYLLGSSNKSWIERDENQSNDLSNAIIKIVESNGTVKIVSNNDLKTIKKHKDFILNYILPKIRNEILFTQFKKNFKYCVLAHSNYSAVISDDRIVLLPTLNSKAFTDESLVLELVGSHLPQFKNYLSDIERIFREDGEIIDLTDKQFNPSLNSPL